MKCLRQKKNSDVFGVSVEVSMAIGKILEKYLKAEAATSRFNENTT